MDLGIEGKKVLVTGASRGLGRSIAECLAQEGTQVALVARNKNDLASFTLKYGPKHLLLVYDLMEPGSPGKMVENLWDNMWHPDIVIHNVGGTLNITDPLCGIDQWRKVYRFNLEIAIELNLLLLPHMQKQKWGRVVHVSSVAALENQGTVPYCSFKSALCAYTRSMGRFVSKDRVNMSAVLPGAVYTEGGYWDETAKTRPEHVEKYLTERMAIQRFGTPEEIGRVVCFLCSEYASFVVGSNFLIDGGQGKGFNQQ